MWLKCSNFQSCFQKDLKNHKHALPHSLISEPIKLTEKCSHWVRVIESFKNLLGHSIAFTYSSVFYDSLDLNCLTSGYTQHLITHIDHIISFLWKLYIYSLLEKIISIFKKDIWNTMWHKMKIKWQRESKFPHYLIIQKDFYWSVLKGKDKWVQGITCPRHNYWNKLLWILVH